MRRFSILSVRYRNDCSWRSERDNPFTLRVTRMKGHLWGIVPVVLILLFLMLPVSAATGNWTEVNGSAEFPARYMHSSVIFDNKMWVIGGYDTNYRDDVWYSSDGKVWYPSVHNAGFAARREHSSVVFDNKMWVIGGLTGALKNDVWNSADGVTWTEATSSAAFSARNSHSSVVFDNKMWVIGGTTGAGGLKDVYNSTDGITWKVAKASAEFPGRFSHSSVVFDNKMWVIGGKDAAPMNDVWYSSNGIDWIRATSAALFPARYMHTSVVYDDKIWVTGGLNSGGTILKDLWYSSDGVTWTEATPVQTIQSREGHSSVISNSKIWTLGGFGYNVTDAANKNSNATWSFQASPVAGFSADKTSGTYPLTVTFTDTSSGYPASYSWNFGDGGTATSTNPVHTYASAGTYSVSLTVTNSDGTGTETKANYIRVTAPPVVNGGDDPPQSAKTEQRAPLEMTVNVGGSSAVSLVTVTGTGLSGLIVTGTVVANPGQQLPPAPGITYQYIELVPARFLTIDGADIFFAVPESWLNEQGLEPEDIVLYHAKDTAWQALPTSVIEKKNGAVMFTAKSTGFSFFAITGTPREHPPRLAPEMTNPPAEHASVKSTPPRSPEEPAPVQTTVPVPGVSDTQPPASPALLILAGIAVCCGIAGAGFAVRRWWMRRQNPALFED